MEHVITPGAGAAIPLRLVFIANPFLKERGRIKRDPIISVPDYFRQRVDRAIHDLFERTPTEFFSESEIRAVIRVSSVFDHSLLSTRVRDAGDAQVLCHRHRRAGRTKIEASRRRVHAFLEQRGLWADVAVVFSQARFAIPTAWFGTDNYSRGGVPFTFDGLECLHTFHSALQGVIAFSSRQIRPFEFRHEFVHALTSFNSGQALDEYDLSEPFQEPGVSAPFAVNKKRQLDSDVFAEYNGKAYAGVTLGSGSKRRYVAALADGRPCLMNRLSGPPLLDVLLRDFLRDRLVARTSRTF